MDENFLQWARKNQSKALIPNALLEPRHPHDGIGAAVVVRGCLYFEKAYDANVRESLAQCFDDYLAVAGDRLTFLWHNGGAAQAFAHAKAMRKLAAKLGENDRFDFDYMSGEHPGDAGFWGFHVFGMRGWEQKMGTRGVDSLDFSFPMVSVQENPDAFVALFFRCAQRLSAVRGHAGFAVDLSPTHRTENESTEYWVSQLMPGLDVGYPAANSERDMQDKIKSVDWLTAISKDMLDRVGGVRHLRSELPPAWFAFGNYGPGVIIRAGVFPESGVSEDESKPPVVPPAYIILDAALRPIRSSAMANLQRGTINGDAPVYNTPAATNSWLRRFETDEAGLLAAKAALLDTPPLSAANALPNPL
ncbi:type VI immunity family protein [Burkholderia gladioli]|uniref:type VI immunity family protein n=1 Tax=Burkholderia gladioli TaxID=28095 RepID=UPI0016419728|nr:type VI immunity family protein [Burkholderia gladioli]